MIYTLLVEVGTCTNLAKLIPGSYTCRQLDNIEDAKAKEFQHNNNIAESLPVGTFACTISGTSTS
jgi:hypothetical protein